MTGSEGLARDRLWEIAATQHGYVTARQAIELGVTRGALNQLAFRGTVERATRGVYRFPRFPSAPADPYMLAVLWTQVPEAVLSHETALDLYDISDINPEVIHVTVGKNRRIRREDGRQYVVHNQDLMPTQLSWWEEVPVVTAATAVAQCIELGTPTYLLRQALVRGQAEGRLTKLEVGSLLVGIEKR